MLIARKPKFAAGLHRRQGMPSLEDLAPTRATAYCGPHRPFPVDPARRARSSSVMRNRWTGFSPLEATRDPDDAVRGAILAAYLRHRFSAKAVAAVDRGGIGAPTPTLDIVVRAEAATRIGRRVVVPMRVSVGS